MVTPAPSRTSPAGRDEASSRNDWRRFSSTVWKATETQVSRDAGLARRVSTLRLGADREQMFAAADIEYAIGDSRGGHDRLTEFVFGKQLVFAARGQHVGVAVFIRNV